MGKRSIGKNNNGVFGSLISIILIVLAVIAFFRLAFGLIYFRVYVVGASMSSTLIGSDGEKVDGGDYVYAFRNSSPSRGDIVIVETKSKTIIKRVIALGGDTVEIKEGVLYLNGNVTEEPYVLPENNTPSENNFDLITVPEGCMFCLGDNRNVSVDSRSDTYGCMPVSWTVGVVADWSLGFKGVVTAINTFFDFTLPGAFGVK